MALPAPDHPCWMRLAGGALSQMNTTHLATRLITKRLERSSDPVAAKAAEIRAFFTKWESSLAHEIPQLTKL
jgi:hypothetical protein